MTDTATDWRPGLRRVEFGAPDRRIRAHYYLPAATAGHPAPVVLVSHGAFGNKEQFQGLAEHLLWAGFAVLVPDMGGHGESSGPRHHVVIDDWVADLEAAIEWLSEQPEIDPRKIGGFGFSSGGTAMLELARRSPHLVTLVTLSATVRSILGPLETQLFRGLGLIGRLKRRWSGADLHLPLYPLMRSTPLAYDPAVSAAVMDDPELRLGYWRYPIPGALESLVVSTLKKTGQVGIPVCVIHGEDDRVDAPASARALFEGLGGEKALHLIPRSGHMGHLDQSRDEVFTIAGRWFRQRLS